MTKKEQLRMRELEGRIAGLEQRNAEITKAWSRLASECIEYKARLESIREVMAWPLGEEYAI